ncbi:hypothetical protein [Methylobacterium hispanicum]|uniref:hypothetical protein n=1 Tax=Methylobacterium hispanicum TaxID=270350 RepID=UPI002F33C469
MPLNTAPLGDETREQLRARLATRKIVQAAARKAALTRLYAALERAVVAGQITGHDARDIRHQIAAGAPLTPEMATLLGVEA